MPSVVDLENFGGGDFKHKTSKIRMSSPILRLNFRPNSKVFFAQNQVVSKKKTKKKTRSSPILRLNFRPKSLG